MTTDTEEIAALKAAIDYCPETGALTWRIGRRGTGGAGSSAGGVNKALGYVQLRFKDRLYYGHRVAFALMTGRWPLLVDHINGNRQDNRWGNLRESNKRHNQENRRVASKGNRTQRLGVAPNHGRFMARLMVGGKGIYLGTFDTPDQAHQAYLQAKRIHHAGGTI